VAIIRAISNVAIPAAIAKLANVCRSDYGVRCSNPAALSAGFRASRRQLCRSMCPPFSAGSRSGVSYDDDGVFLNDSGG
jgi:hypothetical protein